MGGHDSVHGSHQLSTNEHDGNPGGAPEEHHERFLDLLAAPGVLVELVHGGVHPHPAEEPLDGVAHAARAHAEYHHRVLRRQPLYPLYRVRPDRARTPCWEVVGAP